MSGIITAVLFANEAKFSKNVTDFDFQKSVMGTAGQKSSQEVIPGYFTPSPLCFVIIFYNHSKTPPTPSLQFFWLSLTKAGVKTNGEK